MSVLPQNLPIFPERLSPMERELLDYVEQLANTLKISNKQFEALEKCSTDMINTRQAILEASLKLLIVSQTSFMTVWLNSDPSLSATEARSDAIKESFTALETAAKILEPLTPKSE